MKTIKQLFVISILLFFYRYGTSGQEINNLKNAFKMSVGYIKFNNIPGFAFQNEYSRELTNFISIAAKFTFSMATNKSSNAYYLHQAMSSINFSLYFTPLNIENHKIILGGGLGYNYYQSTSNLGCNHLGQIEYLKILKYNTGLGFNYIAGYEYTINEKYLLGFHAMAIGFDDALSNFAFNLGYRF